MLFSHCFYLFFGSSPCFFCLTFFFFQRLQLRFERRNLKKITSRHYPAGNTVCFKPANFRQLIKDPFSLTVMHRGRFVVSGTQKVAVRDSSLSGGEICFHLNSLFTL